MLKPIHDQILVEEVANTVSSNRTIMLLQRTHSAHQARVVSVSDGYFETENDVEKIPVPVKVGDIILFSRGSGYPVTIDERQYLMVRREQILGILTE